MIEGDIAIEKLGKSILQERKTVKEINSLFNYFSNADTQEEKRMISSQIEALVGSLRKTGQEVISSAEKISLFKPLYQDSEKKAFIPETEKVQQGTFQKVPPINVVETKLKLSPLEKITLERMKKTKKKVVKKKEKRPSKYAMLSSSLFYNFSMSLINKGLFKQLKRDLIRGNMEFVPANYISFIFFTTVLSAIAAVFITLFFLFFNIIALPPFIVGVEESLGVRFLKVFWILFFIPVTTFLFTYFYPSLEKKSLESKINQELPFAAIHMSSISSSMIEPSKIFSIIVTTKEYPYLEKEFIKLQNEINIYGYDLVTALRNRAFNSPSRKLSELFNGLATSITSGGNLSDFFEKRSESLLFEYRLDKEKQSKASETFMDIYISVVIAAPMILMLLLMMMRISGLGISLSPSMITLIMVLGVTLVNIFFLTFLHLKQPEEA